MQANIAPASPLGGDTSRQVKGPGLTLMERRDVGVLLIRGKQENADFVSYFQNVLGVEPPEERNAVSAGEFSIVRMGRMDYLISGEIGAVAALSRKAEAAAEGVPCIAAEITHGRLIVEMQGAGAVTVLSKSCGLDIRLQAFPIGLGTRTRFADTLAYVERIKMEKFRLICDRALGEFFWVWLNNAGREFLV